MERISTKIRQQTS